MYVNICMRIHLALHLVDMTEFLRTLLPISETKPYESHFCHQKKNILDKIKIKIKIKLNIYLLAMRFGLAKSPSPPLPTFCRLLKDTNFHETVQCGIAKEFQQETGRGKLPGCHNPLETPKTPAHCHNETTSHVKSHVKTIYKKILKVQNRQTGPSWLQQAPGHSQFHSSQELQICICSALPHLSYGFICDISKLVSLSQVFRTVFRWRTRVIQQTLRLASWLVCSYCRHSISLGWSLSMLAIPCDTRVCKSLVPKQRLSLV